MLILICERDGYDERIIEMAEYVAENGYDPQFGARPLKRYLQKNVETEAARIILRGNLSEGSTIIFDAADSLLIYYSFLSNC